MTAVGALCRQYMGVNPRNPSLLSSIRRLKALPPNAEPSSSTYPYYAYYASRVMFNRGGDVWDLWNLGPLGTGKGGIRDTLLARQDDGMTKQGNKGSWAGSPH